MFPINKIEQKKHNILDITKHAFNIYDDATNDAIRKINTDIQSLTTKTDELYKMIDNHKEKNGGERTFEVMNVYDEIGHYSIDMYWLYQHLNVLWEMKIVYLFKCLEISMKSLINEAYPDIKTKGVYQWDTIINQFKSFNIDIVTLSGYQEATDLKKLNNCIKHSGEITDEVKKIKEFINVTELLHTEIQIFYNRIKPKVISFVQNLSNAVVDDLYYFDDNRLESISTDFAKRMDNATIKKFIEIMSNKTQD